MKATFLKYGKFLLHICICLYFSSLKKNVLIKKNKRITNYLVFIIHFNYYSQKVDIFFKYICLKN